MTCIFFGHADAPDSIKHNLKKTIIQLINAEGIKAFYVGNNGNFDYYVQGALKEIAQTQKDICYHIVLSHINEKAINACQDITIFPEGLEKTLPRFAISKRNEWLIKNADIVVAYVKYKVSHCYNWAQKAAKKGLKVINIADTSIGIDM